MDKKATPRSARVLVVPCSGIGKSYGTVRREAAYILAEELRPDQVETLPLSPRALGDQPLHQRNKGTRAGG